MQPVSNFCPLPTNWGYRDSKYFWCSDFVKPDAIGIPDREVDLTSIQYAAKRLNTDVTFTDDALKTIVKFPRPFFEARPPRLREMGGVKRREGHLTERDANHCRQTFRRKEE